MNSPIPMMPDAAHTPLTWGLKIILMSTPGAGKTHALRTLIDAGLEVFCVITEPNAFNTLMNTDGASQTYKDALRGSGQLHWKYIPPAETSWTSMMATAKLLTDFDLSSIQKMAPIDKRQHAQFMQVLATCANFHDDLTGKDFGPIDALSPEKHAFALDSLSGMNSMFLSHVCGTKPVKSQPEWGAAIEMELNFLNHLTFGIPVHLVVTAHITRETDEVLGGIKTMVNALGRKAPQELPKNFTDCILAKREGNEYSWSTADLNVETKATTLKPGGKYPPTFVPLIETWRQRVANIQQGASA